MAALLFPCSLWDKKAAVGMQAMKGRDREAEFLKNIFDHSHDPSPFVYLTGASGTGKTALLKSTTAGNPSVFHFDCKEWIDCKSFYVKLSEEHFPAADALNVSQLRSAIARRLQRHKANFYVILDNLDWLPKDELDSFVVPLIKAAHTPLNLFGTSRLCVVAVAPRTMANLPFFPVHLHFAEYPRQLLNELVFELLVDDFLEGLPFLRILVEIGVDYFHHVYPDLNELAIVCRKMAEYCVQTGVAASSSMGNSKSSVSNRLYKLVLPRLKFLFNNLYAHTGSMDDPDASKGTAASNRALGHLPVLSKQLLVCAFLASHRNEKYDVSLFSNFKKSARDEESERAAIQPAHPVVPSASDRFPWSGCWHCFEIFLEKTTSRRFMWMRRCFLGRWLG